MKVARLLTVVLFAVGMLVPRARTQEMPPKDASPKPAPSASEALLQQWNDIGRKLITMSEDFPADKYDFKPTPAVRSFAERLIHGAAASYFFTNLALGEKAPGEEDPPRAQFKNKAALVAYVKKSFADGAAAIKSKGDKGMSDLVVDPFAEDVPERAGQAQIRLGDLAHSLVEHSGRGLRPADGLLPCGGSGPPGITAEEVAVHSPLSDVTSGK